MEPRNWMEQVKSKKYFKNTVTEKKQEICPRAKNTNKHQEKGRTWGLQMNSQKKENPPVTSPKNSLFTSVEKRKLKETCEGGSVRSYMLREPS